MVNPSTELILFRDLRYNFYVKYSDILVHENVAVTRVFITDHETSKNFVLAAAA